MNSASSPSWLKRSTNWLTLSPLLYPVSLAAFVKDFPACTASRACARFTTSRRSLVALILLCNSCSSCKVNGRNGCFCSFPMRVSLLQEVYHPHSLMASQLLADPLGGRYPGNMVSFTETGVCDSHHNLAAAFFGDKNERRKTKRTKTF